MILKNICSIIANTIQMDGDYREYDTDGHGFA